MIRETPPRKTGQAHDRTAVPKSTGQKILFVNVNILIQAPVTITAQPRRITHQTGKLLQSGITSKVKMTQVRVKIIAQKSTSSNVTWYASFIIQPIGERQHEIADCRHIESQRKISISHLYPDLNGTNSGGGFSTLNSCFISCDMMSESCSEQGYASKAGASSSFIALTFFFKWNRTSGELSS